MPKKPRKPNPEKLEAEKRDFWAKVRRDGEKVGAIAEILLPFDPLARRRILRMVAVYLDLDELAEDLRVEQLR